MIDTVELKVYGCFSMKLGVLEIGLHENDVGMLCSILKHILSAPNKLLQ